jgi:hypothetical protein
LLLLQRIAGAALAIALFVVAFIFASLLLALGAVAALGLWGWLWWRSRNAPAASGTIIEGEFRREAPQPLPRDGATRRDPP